MSILHGGGRPRFLARARRVPKSTLEKRVKGVWSETKTKEAISLLVPKPFKKKTRAEHETSRYSESVFIKLFAFILHYTFWNISIEKKRFVESNCIIQKQI